MLYACMCPTTVLDPATASRLVSLLPGPSFGCVCPSLLQTEVFPNVALTQSTDPINVLLGDNVTITVNLTNTGDGTAVGALMTQMLPAELEYTGTQPAGKQKVPNRECMCIHNQQALTYSCMAGITSCSLCTDIVISALLWQLAPLCAAEAP